MLVGKSLNAIEKMSERLATDSTNKDDFLSQIYNFIVNLDEVDFGDLTLDKTLSSIENIALCLEKHK